ncbi:NTP transferase domain-containing protein [Sphingorhabdus sp.]|uniref:NTP transferase domain-containing protein n=1 Tax=Sphingorhabdus sp. TaxID=1902408 RepID=UPI002FDA75E9
MTILILAGQRSGKLDPLAERFGVSHKALVPIKGKPLIAHVLKTVSATFPDSPILISIEDYSVLKSDPVVARLHKQRRVSGVEAKSNIVDSVAEAAKSALPLLVTTADNVLVTEDALLALARAGQEGDADSVLVMAPKEAIISAHPGGKDRFYRFANGEFSNCNLFWIGNARAMKAAEAFRSGGQFLKVKGRMLKAFGILNLLRFKSGMFSVEAMLGHASRKLGARVKPLILHDGRLAIDVDHDRSYAMVEEILDRN